MHEPSPLLPIARPQADPHAAPRAATWSRRPWSRRRKLVLLLLLVAGSWIGLAVLLLAAWQLAELQAESGLLRYLAVF